MLTRGNVVTKKEIDELKKEVKAATGMKLSDIVDIKMFSDTDIQYCYYQNTYDKATNTLSYSFIQRKR